MKRFVTILTVIIATAAIALTVMPTTFAFEITNDYETFKKENEIGCLIFESDGCTGTMDYDGEALIFNIVPNSDEVISIIGKVYSQKNKEMVPGILIKYVLPDGTTYLDISAKYGNYGNFKFTGTIVNDTVINGKTGLWERLDLLNSDDAYAMENLSEEYKKYIENIYRTRIKEGTDKWHYNPEQGIYGPENLDEELEKAKGTFYEDLIVEWVNKVRTEREDYAYYQEMQNGNAEIPTVETPVIKANKFTDVTTAHWANANIEKIANLGYFSGYEDGTFRPDNQITHEEFIKVIVDFGLDGTENAPANSASANWAEWAQPYLNAALNAGIVTADDTDLLAVNTPITRGEMAKVIGRLKTYLTGTNNTAADVSDKIADWNNIPDAYKNYVAEAYNEGILSGYEDGTFKSNKSLTRAEASSVIVKLIDDDEPAVTTPMENVNTIVEPANNVNVTTHRINGTTIEWEFDVPPVILNNECLIALDDVIKHDKGFSYRKSANSVRYTTNIGFFVADMPVSANGEPVDYEFNRWNSRKETIHFDTPIQVINGKIMIPVSVLNVVWTDAPTTWVQN